VPKAVYSLIGGVTYRAPKPTRLRRSSEMTRSLPRDQLAAKFPYEPIHTFISDPGLEEGGAIATASCVWRDVWHTIFACPDASEAVPRFAV
jgi:hypothetical protein